jgi:hypothetical protein
MMKVYILETGGCMDQDHDFHGVFSSRENADEWSEKNLSKYDHGRRTVTEVTLDKPGEEWKSWAS